MISLRDPKGSNRFNFAVNIHRIIEPKEWKELKEIKNPHERAKWLEVIEEEINLWNKSYS